MSRPDEDGGGTVTLFERHDADGAAVCGAGEAISTTRTSFSDVREGLTSRQAAAATNVSGDLSAPARTVAQPAIDSASELERAATVGGAAVVMFGMAVADFNQLVDRFNTTISAQPTIEEKQAKKASLTGRYDTAAAELERTAQDAIRALNHPADAQSLQTLWDAGALPSSAPDLFAGAGLGAVTAIPYDIANGPASALVDYLEAHPELMDDPEALDSIEDRIADLDAADADTDASDASDAAADGDSAAAREALANAALIALYSQHAQGVGDTGATATLPPGATSYLRRFNERIWADGPGPVEDLQRVARENGEDDWSRTVLGNAVLAASDETLHADGEGTVPEEVTDALHDLPRIELVDADVAGGRGAGLEIQGGAGYQTLAGLFGDTGENGLEGGRDLSADMTNTTADLVRRLDEIEDHGINSVPGRAFPVDELRDTYDAAGQHMMDAASRNEQANVDFLERANHSADGADDLVTLYRHDWRDDGSAAAGYTDWIERDLDRQHADDPDWAHRRELATNASADIIDLLTETGRTQGEDNGRVNVFADIMGEGHGDEGSYGMINPDLADSIGGVAGANLDALGDNPAVNTTGVDDGRLSIAEDDRGRLTTLINTDPDAATHFNARVGAYQGEQLQNALDPDNGMTDAERSDALAQAARVNGRLEGYANAGDVNAHLIGTRLEYDDQMGDYEDARQAAGLAKDYTLGAFNEIPGMDLTLGPILDAAGDEAIDQLLTEPPNPESHHVGDASDEEALGTRATYDYLRAYEITHGNLPPGTEDLADPEGRLLPWDQLQGGDALLQTADATGAGDYANREDYQPAERFDEAALDPRGTNTDERVDDYLDGSM